MITLGGVEYTLSAIEAVIVLTLLVVLIWVGLKLMSLLVATLRFINGDDTLFRAILIDPVNGVGIAHCPKE